MSMTIILELYDEDDNEIFVELPARYSVCTRCSGHGSYLNPSIGNHAYTHEEFLDAFDEEEREEYFKRGGRYDVQCVECKGNRVVKVVDENALNDSQKTTFELWRKGKRESARFEREWAAEQAMERAMGC